MAFQQGACDNSVNHFIESLSFSSLAKKDFMQYTLNGEKIRSDTAIGVSYKMISVSINDFKANGYPGFPEFNEFQVAIPEYLIDKAFAYFKSFVIQHDISFPGFGLMMRVGRYNDDTWLGMTGVGEDKSLIGQRFFTIEAGRTYPMGFTEKQYAAYDEKMIEVTAYLVENFKGRLHTGKNQAEIWKNDKIKKRYEGSINGIKGYLEDFDSYGVFSNKLVGDLGMVWPKKGLEFSEIIFKRRIIDILKNFKIESTVHKKLVSTLTQIKA